MDVNKMTSLERDIINSLLINLTSKRAKQGVTIPLYRVCLLNKDYFSVVIFTEKLNTLFDGVVVVKPVLSEQTLACVIKDITKLDKVLTLCRMMN